MKFSFCTLSKLNLPSCTVPFDNPRKKIRKSSLHMGKPLFIL